MVYHGKEKENHRGSIVKWPILKVNERDDSPVVKWVEDVLLEPVNAQVLVTKKHGLVILSHGQYPKVEVTDANLWDDECELAYELIKSQFNLKYKSK